MADDEQFSLCWNNFNSNLSAGFHESLQRGDLVDVTLAAEGQLVQAHRLVLSVCSPYFRKMFNQMPKNQHAFVFLKDVTHAALQDLIQFMYCGEVNVKQDALPAFISTAEALQIKGLTETGDSAPPQQSPAKEEVSAVPATTASISTTVPAASQRIKSQRNRVQSYKIESEESGDDKIVHIQASTSHHVSAQQLQAQTNISSQKRTMSQRGVTSHAMKRPKISISASSDGMDTSDNTHTPAQAQTVQTVQIVKQIPAQVIEPEYIELPMESINPKAEPDYTDETAEIETVDAETEQEHKLSEHDEGDGDDDGHYVEDETYGDMAMGKYEESYLTEGEDGAKPGASGFVDSYTSDGGTGTEQSTQDIWKLNSSTHSRQYVCKQLSSRKAITMELDNETPKQMMFVRSSWGRKHLLYDGYTYASNKRIESTNTTYWRCTLFHRRNVKVPCEVRCTVRDGKMVKMFGKHNHPPEVSKFDGKELETEYCIPPESATTSNDQPSGCPMTSMPDSAVELKFIKSPWSTPCLVLNNFLYNCHSTRGDICYWRCHNYSRKVKEERCRARCVVKNGRLSALTGAQHNHPPHTEKIERIVRRNHADELQEQEMMRIQQQQQHQQQQQQQQHQDLLCYQQEGEIKSQTHLQTSKNILLGNRQPKVSYIGQAFGWSNYPTKLCWMRKEIGCTCSVTSFRERKLIGKSDSSYSNDSLAVFSTTMRGKEQLIYLGQPFVFEKLVLMPSGQSKKIWRCNQWWNQKCRARVYTIDRQITPLNGYHTHTDIVKRKQRVVKRTENERKSGLLSSDKQRDNSKAAAVQHMQPKSAQHTHNTTEPIAAPKSSSTVEQNPKENIVVTSKKIPLNEKGMNKTRIIDKVPLHAGSSVYIATKDLFSIYSSKPAVYTGRLIELMFGIETLKISCVDCNEKASTNLIPLDPTILDAVITHIVHVFQQQKQHITNVEKKLSKRKGTQLFSMIDNKHVVFSDTANGGKQLMYKNYIYHRNIKTGNTVYWRCSKAMRLKCKATIVTKEDLMRVNDIEHNHVPMRRLTYGLDIKPFTKKISTVTQYELTYTSKGNPCLTEMKRDKLKSVKSASGKKKEKAHNSSSLTIRKFNSPVRIDEGKIQYTSGRAIKPETSLCFRTSQKGKLQLSHEGFYYCMEKKIQHKEYWRCIYYTTKIKCHGRLHLYDNKVHQMGAHNHAPQVFKRADYKRLPEICGAIAIIELDQSKSDHHDDSEQPERELYGRYDSGDKVTFGVSQRGAKKLIYDRYEYIKDRDFLMSTNWRCALFRRHNCRARAVTKIRNGKTHVRLTNQGHNHTDEAYHRKAPILGILEWVPQCEVRHNQTGPSDADVPRTSLRARETEGTHFELEVLVAFEVSLQSPRHVKNISLSNIQRACFEFTTRGTQCLVYDGFLYSKNKTFENGTRVNWKCRFYHRLHCKARAQTRLIDGIEYVKVFKNEHSHPQEAKSMRRRKRKIKHNLSQDQDQGGFDSDTMLKFSTTQRGHPLLVHYGFTYIRNGEFADTINWRCSKHRKQKCKAKAITMKQDGQNYVKLSYPTHNHPPGMPRQQRFKNVYLDISGSIDSIVFVNLPLKHKVVRKIYHNGFYYCRSKAAKRHKLQNTIKAEVQRLKSPTTQTTKKEKKPFENDDDGEAIDVEHKFALDLRLETARSQRTKKNDQTKWLKIDLSPILQKPSEPVVLVPCRLGGMKVSYHGFDFEYHTSKSGIKHYRCVHHAQYDCKARIIVKASRVYDVVATHSHDTDS
uniref:BTB domain-containing protein n=1 Tax=Anopheles funestus TaxID=62324 RepID=A0A4Y0APV2_ANOFN